MSTQQVTVWFQLYIGKDKSGRADKIILSQGDDITDFCDKVKAKCPHQLDAWDANQLEVYPIGTTAPFDPVDALRGDQTISSYEETSYDHPFVVVARPKVSSSDVWLSSNL